MEVATGRELLLVGDLVLLEVLQGARNNDHAAQIERGVRRYPLVSLLDVELACRAACNARTLRGLVTIRKTADVSIGTFRIETHHTLLHDDRDFLPMEQHLGFLAA